jgi:hypothetical protein
MKSKLVKNRILLLLLLSVFLLECNCEKRGTCKTVCDNIDLPDLVGNGLEISFVDTNSYGDIYEIIHSTVNTIDDVECEGVMCDDLPVAGKHHYRQQISYSEENPNDPYPIVIDSLDFVHEQIPPCTTLRDTSSIQFLQDGYYFIVGIVDVYNEVEERNEDNNDLNSIQSNTKSTQCERMVIHVEKGLEPIIIEGKKQYIKILYRSSAFEKR